MLFHDTDNMFMNLCQPLILNLLQSINVVVMHMNREIKIWWPRNYQVLFHLLDV